MRGHQFTWEKSRGKSNRLEERLDKVLATAEWCGLNGQAGVENILTRKSDHSILFLSIDAIRVHERRGPRGFKFEMAWLQDTGCRDVVESAWQSGKDEGLLNCQQYCRERLMRWGRDRFHQSGRRISELKKRQGAIRNRRDPAALAEIQTIDDQLACLIKSPRGCVLEAAGEAALA
ncbi:PREDICTED: uncharacterized protein LOC109158065 [Ipomoea nil]|uniref:uncharacterized protein LOC109158065 n=1 Tax=Ipomoea nil TaxID=35883 RepID=UPI000901348B|nr:PREDICTED: uncharacterized protein LOC109158065 [Ipomoea nil]